MFSNRARPTRYAELHCRTNFSFLQGASHPHELVARGAELGLDALAITDLSGLYGVVRAWEAARRLAKEAGAQDADSAGAKQPPPRLLYGSELALDPQRDAGGALVPRDALVVLARDVAGYAALSQLITRGRRRVEKGSFELYQREVRDAGGASIVVVAGGPRSRLLQLVRAGDLEAARTELGALREAFGDALYLELTRHRRPGDRERSLALLELGRTCGVSAVATNDVHFHQPHRKKLHDVLSCIARGCTLAEAGRTLLSNAERHLKGGQQLARLSRRGVVQRLGPQRAAELRPQLERELSVIAQLDYAGYFLTMWEVVRFCRRQAILCQGRGSAANSLVCYALGITGVSPDQIDMLFERFISLERREPPDIDLDIEHDRREEVIQHVYAKYGREHAAMVATVICYRHKSAVRDVGKALGLSEQTVLRISRYLAHGWQSAEREAARAAGIDPEGRLWKQLLLLASLLVDFPRHLSIHTGGFLLSSAEVADIVPVENGRMAQRTVIQWDKDDIDALGLFKVDLLGLGMLNVIARAFRLVDERYGVELDLASVPQDDAATYAMIQRADTIGVFQIESRAQMNMLPRLRPRSFYDLVIEVALVRPGPIQGGMVHPYLRRRRGEERIVYPHKRLKKILRRTLGVPIFQEQVMRIAVAVGGYTPGEADQLRRDMAAWRRSGNMERHQKRLYAAMRERGIAERFAERIIQQIEGFGSYGFPESHAAAFAHLVYISAYLKCHFPAAFTVALINAQPMGFYQVASIVADAHRHGVRILGVDVQHSAWEATLTDPGPPGTIRLGLRSVRGLSRSLGDRIVEQRERRGSFASIADLAGRCKLPRGQLVTLGVAGALRSLAVDRRDAIWRSAALGGEDLVANLDHAEPAVCFPRLPLADELRLDYTHADSFLERHPMQLYRSQLAQRGVLRASDLDSARPQTIVQVAGLVIVRQRPGGGKMIFMALEDETGLVDIAVYLALFQRHRSLILLSEILLIEGELQRDSGARSVLARRFANITGRASGVRSRDFH